MRGQHTVVAAVLVTTIGLILGTTYYLYAQGVFFQTKSNLQRVIEEYTDLAKRYIEISSATARIVSDENSGTNIVQLMVTITNTGDNDIVLYGASLYIYKNEVLVFAQPVAPVFSSPDCSGRLPSKGTCTFTIMVPTPEYSTPEDIRNSRLVMYINDSRKASDIEYVGSVPGDVLYLECNSCESCSLLLSNASPGTIVMLRINDQVSGDCVQISGANDVSLYCQTELVGNGTGIGIRVEDSDNVSIYGCEVKNFEYGVYVRNSRNISFSNCYFHDNVALDIAFDPATVEDVCTVKFAGVMTTSGYVYFAADSSLGEVTVLGASALWLIGTRESILNGEGSTLSHVSPAIALCNTSSVFLSSFDVTDTEVGVFLKGDHSTRLESLNVSSRTHGIYSHSSSSGYICCSTFYSHGVDIFNTPSGIELDYQTVFVG